LPFSEWNRVVEAWVGVSRRAKVEKAEGQDCCWSIYGSARRTNVAGSAVPSTEVSAVDSKTMVRGNPAVLLWINHKAKKIWRKKKYGSKDGIY